MSKVAIILLAEPGTHDALEELYTHYCIPKN